jgi:5-(carboxyamino)imidazole ribonucleotide synthase
MTSSALPGATIGILGSGQLGRMLAIAARRMGYRIHTLSPDSDSPAGQVADREYTAAYDDLETVERFASGVDVITLEFENVPSATVDAAERHAPVRPSGFVLHTAQNRLREKTFLKRNGFPVAPFQAVSSMEDLHTAIRDIGVPAVLKTAGFGYDGKGQIKIDSADSVESIWRTIDGQESVLEGFIDFEREVSVVAARGMDDAFTHYGVVDNTHRNHILDLTVSPADVSPAVFRESVDIARGVLEALDVVGVMCVEFFVTRAGGLLINEIAPRVHNSGHFTFDACVTSQFEQQIRAVCGLPPGSTDQFRPAAMVNLLGDLWSNGEPDWLAALRFPEAKLHLYGKQEARPGRKMGHITVMADTTRNAATRALAARGVLSGNVVSS